MSVPRLKQYSTELGNGWTGRGIPGERQPPVHTRTFTCASCGETLSSPGPNYECPAVTRRPGYIPFQTLPKLR